MGGYFLCEVCFSNRVFGVWLIHGFLVRYFGFFGFEVGFMLCV